MPIEKKQTLNGAPNSIMQVVRVFLRDEASDLHFTSQDTTFYLVLGTHGTDFQVSKEEYVLKHMLGAIQLVPLPGAVTELAFVVYDNELTKTDFCQEIIVRFRALWDSLVSRLAEMDYIGEAGDGALDPPERFVFRKRGEVWEIAYEGDPFFLTDIKGLHHIAHLLRSPGTDVNVNELVAAVEKHLPDPAAKRYDEDLPEGVSDLGDDYQQLGQKAKREIRARLQELDEEIRIGAQIADDARAEKAQAEKDEILAYYGAAIGLAGRSRRFTDEHERARQIVQKAVSLAIKRIGKHDSGLADYLGSTINTGHTCFYHPDPDNPIDWKL